MSEGLLSCPFCGGDDVCDEILSTGMCKSCGALGPAKDSGWHWNVRASALTWTSERPTVPGWYWVKPSGAATICRITRDMIDSWDWNRWPSCQFAGPIPEPVEPAKEGGG